MNDIVSIPQRPYDATLVQYLFRHQEIFDTLLPGPLSWEEKKNSAVQAVIGAKKGDFSQRLNDVATQLHDLLLTTMPEILNSPEKQKALLKRHHISLYISSFISCLFQTSYAKVIDKSVHIPLQQRHVTMIALLPQDMVYNLLRQEFSHERYYMLEELQENLLYIDHAMHDAPFTRNKSMFHQNIQAIKEWMVSSLESLHDKFINFWRIHHVIASIDNNDVVEKLQHDNQTISDGWWLYAKLYRRNKEVIDLYKKEVLKQFPTLSEDVFDEYISLTQWTWRSGLFRAFETGMRVELYRMWEEE